MHSGQRILIVEDDEAIAAGLALNLRIAGYEPEVVHDGEHALAAVTEIQPHLILLDINLPKQDGISLLADLRTAGHQTPVIMLTARIDEYDKVAALRLGADDYVTKPFALAELMARVDAVLRRSGNRGGDRPDNQPATLILFGEIAVDMATRTATRAGEPIKLTHLEFELLSFLARQPSKVFSRDELLRQVWGQTSGTTRTIDNFVGQLRSKLESDPENPRHFITVRGSGYRFDP
ncbi:MAG: response regulator transcription factor [Proteobacteria bacterium]|nr:response regulator transcription factor [Pseudomonadota bacterium]